MSPKLIKRINIIEVVFTIMLCTLILCHDMSSMASGHAQYKSWVRDTIGSPDSVSGISSTGNEDIGKTPEDTKPNTVDKTISSGLAKIGVSLMKSLEGGAINCSINGIIFGRLASNDGINMFGFDLYDGNMYGQIGASIYTVMRGIAYILLYMLCLSTVVHTAYEGGDKGHTDLKEGVYTAIIVILLIVCMPQIADTFIFLRDKLMVAVYDSLMNFLPPTTGATAGAASTTLNESISNEYYNYYVADPTILNSLIFLAVTICPIFFIVSYIKIAIQQTILFGFFPAFAIVGYKDKHIIQNWTAVFISNLFIPVIDTTLMLMPRIMQATFYSLYQNKNKILLAIIITTMFQAIIPARNEILKMFGNATGSPAGRGFAGIAQMAGRAVGSAAMLARMSSMGKRGGGHAINGENGVNSIEDGSSPTAGKDVLSDQKKELADLDGTAPKDDTAKQEAASGLNAEGKADAGASGDSNADGGNGLDADDKKSLDGADNDNAAGEGGTPNPDDNPANGLGDGADGDGSTPLSDDESAAEAAEETVAAAAENGDGGPAALDEPTGDSEGGSSDTAAPAYTGDPEVDDAINGCTVTAKEMEKDSGLTGDSEELNKAITEGGLSKEVAESAQLRGANLATIDKMNDKIASGDSDTAARTSAISDSKNKISDYTDRINTDKARAEQLRGEIANSPIKGVANQAKVNELHQCEQRMADNKAGIVNEQKKIAQNQKHIQTNNKVNAALKGQVAKRQGVERRIAQAHADNGSTGRMAQTFSSTKDYTQAVKHQANLRKMASYKNYDSSCLHDVLSPAEKRAYQRKRNVVNGVTTGFKIAGCVTAAAAVAAGSAASAVVFSVGGEDASVAAANAGMSNIGTAAWGGYALGGVVGHPVGVAAYHGGKAAWNGAGKLGESASAREEGVSTQTTVQKATSFPTKTTTSQTTITSNSDKNMHPKQPDLTSNAHTHVSSKGNDYHRYRDDNDEQNKQRALDYMQHKKL
jgi:hypothetical protein